MRYSRFNKGNTKMSSVIGKTLQLNDDTEIPAVGFGTYLISPTDAADTVRAAISIGYRHIDTATIYRNEVAVGAGIRSALKDNGLTRKDIFVTTKLWPGHAPWNDEPKSEEQTIAECEASLARLGFSYIDLYLIHSPHGGSRRVEQWRALLELKRTGKARSVGVSNFGQRHLEEIKAAGLSMPEANQIELHPWSQKPELIAYMRQYGITPIAYSSLAPLSTWRTRPGQDSAKSNEMKAGDNVLSAMAAKYGVTQAQLLLRWSIQNGYAVIPKSVDPERIRINIDLDGFSIVDQDMALITTLDRGEGIAWSMGDPTLIR
jgi:2,5-diketo-D-gluconate reductase A